MSIRHDKEMNPMPFEEALSYKRLVHELRTHQLELEMQNDELRRTELRLRETSKRYADLYDFAPVAYFTLTGRGVIREVNLKGSSYLGCDRVDLIGNLLSQHVIEEDRECLSLYLRDTLNGLPLKICNLRMQRSDGLFFDAELECESWREEKEQRTCIRALVRDVTDRKALEAELRSAKERAEQSNQAKTQFLANMSHEMRTPLGVIIGFTDLILTSSPSVSDLEKSLETIHRNGEHLLNLIDELLDLAKVEADQMKIELLDVPLDEEISRIVEQLQPKAASKNLQILIEKGSPLPATIRTDPIRFRQILLNILSNAIKFTDQGVIQLELSMVDVRKANSIRKILQIEITDSGCGIASDKQALLFRPFSQADASTTRKYGGTGLGLCLAKRLAEALGGTVILLKSSPDVGSTFRITLDPGDLLLSPVLTPTLLKQGLELHWLGGAKILLVEDGADNRLLFKTILESAGAQVQCAEDGFEAVSFASKETYDLVLMDIQLPKMDGYMATASLRQKGCTTPIVALSAHALAEERKRAIQEGFSGYISKPVSWSSLTTEVARWTNALH